MLVEALCLLALLSCITYFVSQAAPVPAWLAKASLLVLLACLTLLACAHILT